MATKDKVIVIRRVVESEHAVHHGGAWKIAYADFVTAMMAFFLLMWLINMGDDEQLSGIADYFTPSSSIVGGLGGEGVMGGTAPQEVGIISDMTLFSEDASSVALTKPQDEWSKLAKNEAIEDVPQKSEREAEEAEQQQASASAAARERDMEQLEQAREDFYHDLRADPDLADLAKSISFEKVEDGLLIQIMDQEGEPMFASGSSTFREETAKLVAKVGDAIKARPNPIAITGHTDATPFSAPSGYTNWELSADRANETRRILIASGVQVERISGISGLAATKPLRPEDPQHASNRRITVHLKLLE